MLWHKKLLLNYKAYIIVTSVCSDSPAINKMFCETLEPMTYYSCNVSHQSFNQLLLLVSGLVHR